MENLYIPSSMGTPMVDFRAESGQLKIKGISTPEDPFVFFAPVIKWLERYCIEQSDLVVLEVQLDYFNTSSARVMLHILRVLDTEFEKGTVRVHWLVEEDDEDLLEVGRDYARILKNLNMAILEIGLDAA